MYAYGGFMTYSTYRHMKLANYSMFHWADSFLSRVPQEETPGHSQT